jgi:hypothetical protein
MSLEPEELIPKEYRVPNTNLFILGLLLLIAFLFVELNIRMFNLYESAPWVDIPSHFLAGIAIGTIALWVISLTLVKRKKRDAVFYTFIVGAIWEILESFEDYFIYNPPWLKDYFFWDGFWDIIVTTAGGLAAMSFIVMLKKKTHFLHGIKV